MLGEDHSLTNEFPEYEEVIAQLADSDKQFASDTNKYNELDEEIRQLELDGTPISDEAMSRKKHERAVLKDSLYQRLVQAGNK